MNRGVWWRGLVVALVLLGSGGLSPVVAQEDEPSYISPSFGYELTWDETWEVMEELSEGGYDLIALVSELNEVYIEGYIGDAGDPATCLDASRAVLAGDEDPELVTVLTAEDGTPYAGQDAVGAFAWFDLSALGAEGEEPYVAYVDCRVLRAGVAVLAITAFVPAADVEPGIEQLDALLATLIIPSGAAGSADPAEFEAFEQSIGDDLTLFWTETFAAGGATYEEPTLVIFDTPVQTACGDAAPEEIGPFYCPADQTIYLDQVMLANAVLPFGEFVVAAVIAHEVGHHVQTLLVLEGCTDEGCGGRGGSLAIELQADCFAGAWAQHAGDRGAIAADEIEQTVIALAAFFGDPPDAQPTDPDAHGPGALRTWWFLKGYYEGAAVCLEDEAAA